MGLGTDYRLQLNLAYQAYQAILTGRVLTTAATGTVDGGRIILSR